MDSGEQDHNRRHLRLMQDSLNFCCGAIIALIHLEVACLAIDGPRMAVGMTASWLIGLWSCFRLRRSIRMKQAEIDGRPFDRPPDLLPAPLMAVLRRLGRPRRAAECTSPS